MLSADHLAILAEVQFDMRVVVVHANPAIGLNHDLDANHRIPDIDALSGDMECRLRGVVPVVTQLGQMGRIHHPVSLTP